MQFGKLGQLANPRFECELLWVIGTDSVQWAGNGRYMGMTWRAGIATAILSCGEEAFLPTDGRSTSPPFTVQAQLYGLLFRQAISLTPVSTGRDITVQPHAGRGAALKWGFAFCTLILLLGDVHCVHVGQKNIVCYSEVDGWKTSCLFFLGKTWLRLLLRTQADNELKISVSGTLCTSHPKKSAYFKIRLSKHGICH